MVRKKKKNGDLKGCEKHKKGSRGSYVGRVSCWKLEMSKTGPCQKKMKKKKF